MDELLSVGPRGATFGASQGVVGWTSARLAPEDVPDVLRRPGKPACGLLAGLVQRVRDLLKLLALAAHRVDSLDQRGLESLRLVLARSRLLRLRRGLLGLRLRRGGALARGPRRCDGLL